MHGFAGRDVVIKGAHNLKVEISGVRLLHPFYTLDTPTPCVAGYDLISAARLCSPVRLVLSPPTNQSSTFRTFRPYHVSVTPLTSGYRIAFATVESPSTESPSRPCAPSSPALPPLPPPSPCAPPSSSHSALNAFQDPLVPQHLVDQHQNPIPPISIGALGQSHDIDIGDTFPIKQSPRLHTYIQVYWFVAKRLKYKINMKHK